MYFKDDESKKNFDAAAVRVFAAIPAEEKEAHAGQLVVINPNANPSEKKQYVFGNNLSEVLKRASEQFGTDAAVQLMSLETDDGHVPETRARAMGIMPQLN